MYYLYLKTHNRTGLKYLGQTKRDPYKYRGSGTRWLNHVAKHGYDVTTLILLITNDHGELKETGLFFSKLWGIVRSKDWANLKEESGDGGFMAISKDNGTHWAAVDPEAQRAHAKRANKARVMTEEIKEKISESVKRSNEGKIHPHVGLKRKKVECPHCSGSFAKNVAVRFHFDNCKHNPSKV